MLRPYPGPRIFTRNNSLWWALDCFTEMEDPAQRSAFGVLTALRSRRVVQRARRALIAGEGAEAKALLLPLVSMHPWNAEWQWLLGRAFDLVGDLDAAERHYRAALSAEPRHAEAERALQHIQELRWKPVMAAWHLYTAGRAMEASHAFAAALHQPTTSTALQPEVWIGLGWCHHALGDAASAAICFHKATELEPLSARALLGHGIACYLGGWLDDAESSLAAAELANPRLHEAASFRGWCAYSRQRYAEAFDHFTRAQRQQPLAADPLWGLAWSRHRQGELGFEAFAAAIRAGVLHPSRKDLAAILPETVDADEIRMLFATRLLDANAAAEALPLVATLAARVGARALVLQARALLLLGRAMDAINVLASLNDAALDEVFEELWVDGDALLHPVETTARELLARAHMAIGQVERAGELARQCLVLRPGHGAAALQLARAAAALNDHEAARAALPAGLAPAPLARAAEDLLLQLRAHEQEPWFRAMEAHLAGDDLSAQRQLDSLPQEDARRIHLMSRWKTADLSHTRTPCSTEPTSAKTAQTDHRHHRP